MKKIIAAAAGLMMVGTLATSASAVESQFGGYWRTRMYTQVDFTGQDTGSQAQADTRTRLYYTAVFNENFKFVNKFEFDNVFGDNVGGDVGADGVIFEVKNSYADFTTGPVRFKVGTQGATISRGFIFADDFSGAYAGIQAGDMANLQFVWAKVDEKEVVGSSYSFVDLTDTDGDGDTTETITVNTPQSEADLYAFLPVITVSDSLSIAPHFTYVNTEGTDDDYWFLGVDVDFSSDAFSVWGTAIYEGGEVATSATTSDDVQAYLLAVGGSVGMFHGQMFYASGDDDAADGDQEAFGVGGGGAYVPGNSYYWSEIMGYGVFDNQVSAGSPADNISNIFAANFGVTAKVAEKLTLSGDLWYAMLAEDNAAGEDDLGVEIDVRATYAIMDNLNLDLVAAYLFADDATGGGDEDPIEVGAQLSLSF
jgi:hypothetical protein